MPTMIINHLLEEEQKLVSDNNYSNQKLKIVLLTNHKWSSSASRSNKPKEAQKLSFKYIFYEKTGYIEVDCWDKHLEKKCTFKNNNRDSRKGKKGQAKFAILMTIKKNDLSNKINDAAYWYFNSDVLKHLSLHRKLFNTFSEL